jgi:hypothetical protein
MTDTIPSCAEFDYGQYEPEVADELRQVADRIRSRCQDQIAAIVHIGKELNEVKKKVGHGNWGSWLKTEFAMSVATADRYVRAAVFADKFVTVTNLQPSTLYVLSAKSTPAALQQEVLDKLGANKPISEKDLRLQIASARKATRTAEALRGAAAEGTAMPAQDGTPPAREEPQPQAFEGQKLEREAANAAVRMLSDRLGDDFRNFVKLWEDAGSAFTSALRDFAAEAKGEMVEAAKAEPTPHPAPSPPIVKTEQQPTGSSPGTVANLLEKRGGTAPRPPAGVTCGHPQGTCGYNTCEASGRCLARPKSEVAA